MTGSLGPGQTTNIALSTDDGEASRILAFAAPTIGFDPASIDLSSFSGLFYEEALRTQVDWIAEEKRAVETCEWYDAWTEEWSSEVRIRLTQDEDRYDPQDGYDFESTNFILRDGDGDAIPAEGTGWEESWERGYEASFSIDLDSDETYSLSTGTGIGEFEFDRIHLNDVEVINYSDEYVKEGDLILSSKHLSSVFLYFPQHLLQLLLLHNLFHKHFLIHRLSLFLLLLR